MNENSAKKGHTIGSGRFGFPSFALPHLGWVPIILPVPWCSSRDQSCETPQNEQSAPHAG